MKGNRKNRHLRLLLISLLICGAALLASCHSSSGTDGAGVRSPDEKIPLPDMDLDEPYPVEHEAGVVIVRGDPARTRLYADVLRPRADGRFPALLQAIAYRREVFSTWMDSEYERLASQGYVVILVDVRGTGSSEGRWACFADEEIDDLVWIIDHWIPGQAWSNGKVGMFGPSYMGIAQYLTAARRPAHLKAIFPEVAMADAYRDIFYQGGIFDLEFITFWGGVTAGLAVLPGTQLFTDPLSALKALVQHIGQIPTLFDWLEMTTDQAFFDERSPMTYWSEMADLPIFATGGWFGIFTRGTLLNHTYMVKAMEERAGGAPSGGAPKRIVVGPWYHVDGALLGDLPGRILRKRWFDWHLKADEHPLYGHFDILDPGYPVNIYVMGADQWRKERAWPLERVRYETLYLSGERQVHDQNPSLNNGSLLWPEEVGFLRAGEAGTAPTNLSHSPPNFAGEKSRSFCRWMVGFTSWLPFTEDERENELQTLTFSTAPLEQDIEVTGPIVIRLWARTQFGEPPCEGPEIPDIGIDLGPALPLALEDDVHWIVNLNDVFPDGRARNITSGWLAASHRPDPARPDWTRPGYDPFAYPEDRAPVPPLDGELYEYVIEIWPTSNLFRAGHQIRIDIVNSDFPHLLPTLVPSESEIFHDPEHPSRLIIPIVDPETTEPNQWISDPQAYFSGDEPW